jgi:hypothetical protein
MRLIQKGGRWQIEGPESERARVSFAVVEGDRLAYEVAGSHAQETVRP